MPLLATVASEHIGKDTQSEVPFNMLKNSPVVQAVRDSANWACSELPTSPPATGKGSKSGSARPEAERLAAADSGIWILTRGSAAALAFLLGEADAAVAVPF
jgi:hypothetical protein